MMKCESCGHPMVFHRENPPEDPCNLCPRGACMVGKCGCKAYDGVPMSKEDHESHVANRIKWGAWGFVQFSTVKEQTVLA